MEALRALPSPAVRRLLSIIDEAPWETAEANAALVPFYTQDANHALLTSPGVAAALAAAAAEAARDVWSPAPIDKRITHGLVKLLVRVLMVAASRCACADEVLIGALVAGLPLAADGPTGPGAGGDGRPWASPLSGHPDAFYGTSAGRAYMRLIVTLVGWATDGALSQPMPGVTPRRAPADGAAAARCPTPDVNTYTPARGRVLRLGENARLLRATVNTDLTTLHILLRDRTQPGTLPLLECSGLPGTRTWAEVGPRELLNAAPNVLEELVDAAELLAACPPGGRPSVGAAEERALVELLGVVLQLGSTDPPRLRALPGLPAVVAAVVDALEGAHLPAGGSPEWLPGISILLMTLYGAGPGAVAVAACAPLVRQLMRWAADPAGRDLGGLAAADPFCSTATMAAALLLHVARATLEAGQAQLPDTFLSADARRVWAALATAPANRILAEVGSQLLDLTHSSRAPSTPMAAAHARPTPWAPAPCPFFNGGLLSTCPRCWTCGSPYPQPPPDGDRDAPLRLCDGCRVAVYCSAACERTGWARGGGGHWKTCGGWRAMGEAGLAAGPPNLPPTLGVGDPRWHRLAALAPTYHPLASRDWRGGWGWPMAAAATVLRAGLALTDVVAVVEQELGRVEILPAAEYCHCPTALPAAAMATAAALHGGRVLRVVDRRVPPVIRTYGPLSLGLGP